MKPSEIEVGKTYINVRTGRTRKVTRIRIPWDDRDPDVAYYVSWGVPGTCQVATFARWAGKEVK